MEIKYILNYKIIAFFYFLIGCSSCGTIENPDDILSEGLALKNNPALVIGLHLNDCLNCKNSVKKIIMSESFKGKKRICLLLPDVREIEIKEIKKDVFFSTYMDTIISNEKLHNLGQSFCPNKNTYILNFDSGTFNCLEYKMKLKK